MAAKGAADPDHTIMVTLNSFYTTPLRQPGIKIDSLTFAPVARMRRYLFVMGSQRRRHHHFRTIPLKGKS